jgi:hypothetical protein
MTETLTLEQALQLKTLFQEALHEMKEANRLYVKLDRSSLDAGEEYTTFIAMDFPKEPK